MASLKSCSGKLSQRWAFRRSNQNKNKNFSWTKEKFVICGLNRWSRSCLLMSSIELPLIAGNIIF
jgi:hypothetical protein